MPITSSSPGGDGYKAMAPPSTEQDETEEPVQSVKDKADPAQGEPRESQDRTSEDEGEPKDAGAEEKAASAHFKKVKEKIKKEWDQLLKVFESEGISVDLKKKRIEVKGAIIRDKLNPQYPFEYVVVSEGGSTHEALILVRATPSNLNAGLLALGLEPGKTISSRKKDPPPSQEDIDSGKESPYEIIPSVGTRIFIYVTYDGWKERPIRFLEDLMIDLRTGKPIERYGWIYVGSRFARVLQGREKVVKYMADMERNIIACYLTGFGNAIFDINSPEGISDTLFDLNPVDAPPMGAKVTLIFTLDPL
jgi:hypothetical protein